MILVESGAHIWTDVVSNYPFLNVVGVFLDPPSFGKGSGAFVSDAETPPVTVQI